MNNPYTAPTAVVDDIEGDDTYMPKFFAVNGRIGRLRYIGYSWLAYFLLYIVFGVLGFIAAITFPMMIRNSHGGTPAFGVFALILIYVPILAIMFIYTRRRLNDLDQTGWLSLLLIIPLIGFLFWLYLIFAPGTDSANRFGPAPSKQSNGAVWVILIVVVTIVVIGILAAVAIPAYQQYQAKVHAARIEQQQQPQQ